MSHPLEQLGDEATADVPGGAEREHEHVDRRHGLRAERRTSKRSQLRAVLLLRRGDGVAGEQPGAHRVGEST